METVFDHNITEEEWKSIRGVNKDLYLKIIEQNTAFADIASLYWLRNEKDIAVSYIEKTSPEMRLDWWRITLHH